MEFVKKETEENKISRDDLETLIALVDKIVALHIKYIKEGFSIRNIAQTFTQVYHRQLQKALDHDDEAVKMVKKEMRKENRAYDQLGQSPKEVASSICIKLASAFVGAVTNISRQNKSR